MILADSVQQYKVCLMVKYCKSGGESGGECVKSYDS